MLYAYAGGTGIPRASAIQGTKLILNTFIPASDKIWRITSSTCANVRPSSASHISAKLFNVTDSLSIITSIPFPNAAVKERKSPGKRFSSKQVSISSASAHSSTTGGISGSYSTTTVLLLLFIHTNLKSPSELDFASP